MSRKRGRASSICTSRDPLGEDHFNNLLGPDELGSRHPEAKINRYYDSNYHGEEKREYTCPHCDLYWETLLFSDN